MNGRVSKASKDLCEEGAGSEPVARQGGILTAQFLAGGLEGVAGEGCPHSDGSRLGWSKVQGPGREGGEASLKFGNSGGQVFV